MDARRKTMVCTGLIGALVGAVLGGTVGAAVAHTRKPAPYVEGYVDGLQRRPPPPQLRAVK